MNVTRARPQFGAAGLVALVFLAAACSPAPSASPAALDPVVLRVPDPVLEAPAIGGFLWSPDGARLSVELASGRVVVVGADGAQLADLAGEDVSWVDRETLAIRTSEPGRSDGPVSLVHVDGTRLQPWPVVQGATGLLVGPAGLAAILGEDMAGGWFRLLVGGMPGPQVKGRGEPVAFSGDGTRLVVVHAGAAAGAAALASTGSSEPGWIEILSVPGLATVAAFPDAPIDVRGRPVLDHAGSRVAADGVGAEIVAFDVEAGTSRAVADTCCPGGWLSTGRLVASGQPLVVIDLEANATRKLADEGWWSAVSSSDRIAAATGDNGQTLLVLRDDRLIATAGMPGTIDSLVWRPDGRMLALRVRSDDPLVRLYLLPVPDLP